MCRWLVYIAHDAVSLKDVVSETNSSLIKQSYSAISHPGFTPQNNATLNADGVGLSWYKNNKAHLYKTTDPAWCDLNLIEIVDCVESNIICGHVRAASPGSVVSRENCHPFRFGRLVFQHNGHIEQFKRIKRRMLEQVSDEAFESINGNTDSEAIFALIVSQLKDASRTQAFKLAELKWAVMQAIEKVVSLLRAAGISGGFTTLNMTLTDGVSVICTRFCDKWPAVAPPSLEFCFEPPEVLIPALEASLRSNQGPGDGSELTDKAAPQKGAEETDEKDYDVTHTRWQEDAKALADASKDAPKRSLIVASEVLTSLDTVKWYALPAQAMLAHTLDADAAGSPPELTRLACGQALALPSEEMYKKQRLEA